jgi:hypothetical protein
MLRCLKLEAAPVAGPLVAAALSIGEMKGVASPERRFLRPSSKWNRHLRAQGKGDTRLWEVAVLFHLRDAFRSGDVWLAHSRRYGDLKQVLVPMIAAQENATGCAFQPTGLAGTERRDSRSLLSGWPGLPVTALFRTVA